MKKKNNKSSIKVNKVKRKRKSILKMLLRGIY